MPYIDSKLTQIEINVSSLSTIDNFKNIFPKVYYSMAIIPEFAQTWTN